jgi:hypothetical protein
MKISAGEILLSIFTVGTIGLIDLFFLAFFLERKAVSRHFQIFRVRGDPGPGPFKCKDVVQESSSAASDRFLDFSGWFRVLGRIRILSLEPDRQARGANGKHHHSYHPGHLQIYTPPAILFPHLTRYTKQLQKYHKAQHLSTPITAGLSRRKIKSLQRRYKSKTKPPKSPI